MDEAERGVIAARWTQGFAQWSRGLVLPKDMPAEQRKILTSGEHTYFEAFLSFIRYAWSNDAPAVTTEEVKKLRREHAGRPTPWTDAELKQHVSPKP